MKVDPKTAYRIAAGEVTAVLRTRKLARDREPVQFERARGEDDAPPRHAEDTTVLDCKCHVAVLEQREVRFHELTDEDAKRLGYKRLFMLKRELADEWTDGRPRVFVTFELSHREQDAYLAKTVGYTTQPSQALDPDAPVVPPHLVVEINQRRSKGLGKDAQEELRKRAARARASSLRDSEVKALNRGVDISGEVAAIDDYLAAIRAKIGEAA